MLRVLYRLWTDESGQGLVEYGLIAALVAGAVIATFPTLRQKVTDAINQVANAFDQAGGTGTP